MCNHLVALCAGLTFVDKHYWDKRYIGGARGTPLTHPAAIPLTGKEMQLREGARKDLENVSKFMCVGRYMWTRPWVPVSGDRHKGIPIEWV